MWLRHWGLERDPFLEIRAPYVSLPSHDEAVSRLVYSIERGQRLTSFFAEAGLGKTTVIRQAIAEARHPRRRIVLVQAPSDGQELLNLLADGLGYRTFGGSRCQSPWRGLTRAVRSAAIEGSQLVFVIDGCEEDKDSATFRDLSALLDIADQGGSPAALIRVGRRLSASPTGTSDPWTLSIGLDRLTRSQVETYLDAKLEAAGCPEPIFTPRALTRLHLWSEGVPRGLDHLAALALMAGAVQGLEVVSPDVVDGIAMRSLEDVTLAPAAR